jgi:hypothetical protein
MGHGHSRQSYTDTTDILNAAIVSTAQSCTSSTDISNLAVITGRGNLIDGLNQSINAKTNVKCLGDSVDTNALSDNLKSSVEQSLNAKSVAGTQWLDTTKVDITSNIVNNITNTVTSSVVQDCTNKVISENTAAISGVDNTMLNVGQSITADRVVNCMMQSSTTSTAVNAITDLANQTSNTTSSNPLSFITDAAAAAFQSLLTTAAVIFIIIICFVGLIYAFRRGVSADPPAAPQPAAAPQPPVSSAA